MYWWNIQKLKNDLLKGNLSESTTFKYFIANTILTSIAMIPSIKQYTFVDVALTLFVGIFVVFGVLYVYQCNKGSEGNNFLQKYFALGWVTGVRWSVFIMLPVLIVYMTLVSTHNFGSSQNTAFFDLFILVVSHVSYYWMLGRNMKAVSG